MWAKQSTAATLIVGPVLASAGAEYPSAVFGDLSISKNGGTLTALAAAATLTHIANGQYTLVMTTGNLDTLGRLQITCNKSTYQMPPIGLVVVPAMVFDSLVLGTDVLQSDVTQFGGTAGTFAAGIPTAALDPATRVKLDATQPDYAPATPAQVNAQVLDVLSVDTFAELVAPPAATSSLKDKITWLFMYARNKVTQTATTRTLYRDDTTTVAGTSGTSDNGTTFTKGEDA